MYFSRWRALEIWVRGHLRSLKMAPFDDEFVIVRKFLNFTIFEISDVEEYDDP